MNKPFIKEEQDEILTDRAIEMNPIERTLFIWNQDLDYASKG